MQIGIFSKLMTMIIIGQNILVGYKYLIQCLNIHYIVFGIVFSLVVLISLSQQSADNWNMGWQFFSVKDWMSLVVSYAIAGQKVAINNLETNELGCVPIQLYQIKKNKRAAWSNLACGPQFASFRTTAFSSLFLYSWYLQFLPHISSLSLLHILKVNIYGKLRYVVH